MPCDWIYRVVIKIACYIVAMRAMAVVASILPMTFTGHTPLMLEMLQGNKADICRLAQQEEDASRRKWARHLDDPNYFYTVRRGAAARAKVTSGQRRKPVKLLAKLDEHARLHFNILLRKTKDSVIAVGTLALETANNFVRFVKKDRLNKIGSFPRLYAHFCWTHVRQLLELNGHKLYGHMIEFVTGSHYCQSLLFALPFESKTPSAPSCSHLNHLDRLTDQGNRQAGLGQAGSCQWSALIAHLPWR